jgi:pyruvate dehydrogenase complex dehydrogenase (E1) component
MYDSFKDQLPDIDPEETAEWIEALDSVIDQSPGRARFLLQRIIWHARKRDRCAADGLDRLHKYDPSGARALLPG